jgi:hypothetical protein
MMKTVTEAEVRIALPSVHTAIELAIDNVLDLIADEHKPVYYAAFQIALIEKAAEFAKKTFATSRVDFALAAKELYEDDRGKG